MHIPAYFINLNQSPTRKHHMECMAKNAGIVLNRFPAISANDLSDKDFRRWHPEGCSDYVLTKGEVCCFLSHMELWKIAANSDASFMAIFEDDISLSPAIRSFLADDDWLPGHVELLRLETTFDKTTVVRRGIKIHDNRTIYQLAGRCSGSAGYIISKSMAQKLLDNTNQIRMGLDWALFKVDEKSTPDLTAWLISPSFCVQQQFSERQFLPKDVEVSSLEAERLINYPPKLKNMRKLIREVKRPFIQALMTISYVSRGLKKVKVLVK